MRRLLLIAMTTMAWLLASPSLQVPEADWLEVGATPAAAQEFQGIMTEPGEAAKSTYDASGKADSETAKPGKKKKSAKKTQTTRKRVGSSGLVTSNQPGFHRTQPVRPAAPQPSVVTGSVTNLPRDPRYPKVQTLPVLPRGSTGGAGLETSQDRVIRCTQQGSLAGISPAQRGTYIQNCAF